MDTSDGVDETDRDDEDESKDDTKDDDSRVSVGFVCTNASHTKGSCDGEDAAVPPFGNLLVGRHQPHVDVLCDVVLGTLAPEELLEAQSNLVAMEKNRIHESRCVHGKEPEVDGQVTGRHPGHRICLILFFVENALGVHRATDVIGGTFVKSVEGLNKLVLHARTFMIIDVVTVDGKICSVPGVGEVHSADPVPRSAMAADMIFNDHRLT